MLINNAICFGVDEKWELKVTVWTGDNKYDNKVPYLNYPKQYIAVTTL